MHMFRGLVRFAKLDTGRIFPYFGVPLLVLGLLCHTEKQDWASIH